MSERQSNRYNEEIEKIDLISLFYMMWKSLRRNFIVVIAIILVCTLGSGLWAVKSYTPRYQAYTSFVVGSGNSYSSTYYDNATAEQLGKTFSYIVTSGVLRDVVARDLGIGWVSSEITASVMENTNLFTITVTDSSPTMAYDVLQSVIENYPEVAEYIIGATRLTVIDESGVPTAPVNERQALQKALIGAVAGVVIAFALLMVLSIRNKTIQRPEELKKMMSAQSLGSIPAVPIKKRSNKARQIVKIDNPRIPNSFKEAVRVMRSRVEKVLEEQEGNVLLVTSAIPGEGKSTVAANLALALAQKGSKVVLIDGDLRHPSVAKALGVQEKEKGIYHILKEGGDLGQILASYGETSLKVLLGNSKRTVENPLPLIRSKKMKLLIDALKESNDYVIIDTPPSAMLSDTVAYGGLADAVLLVVRQDFTEQKQVRKALETIADANIPVAGYVLNCVADGIGGYGYYSSYGYHRYGYRYGYGKSYGYGYGEKSKKDKKK